MVHRDIKPDNILLPEGHAIVADFGIARASRGGEQITESGIAIGTPEYMSPEQASGGNQVDGRRTSTAGPRLYETPSGEPPFTGPSAQAIAAKHLQFSPSALAYRSASHSRASGGRNRARLGKGPGGSVSDRRRVRASTDRNGSVGRGERATACHHGGSPRLAGVAVVGMMLVERQARGGGGRSVASAAAGPGFVADPTHIAVLYFDAESQDTAIKWVANGLTEDLIDQLGQVEALERHQRQWSANLSRPPCLSGQHC